MNSQIFLVITLMFSSSLFGSETLSWEKCLERVKANNPEIGMARETLSSGLLGSQWMAVNQ